MDLSIGNWTALPDLNQGRWGHVCGMAKGEIVVVGGKAPGRNLRSTEIFSLGSGILWDDHNWGLLLSSLNREGPAFLLF